MNSDNINSSFKQLLLSKKVLLIIAAAGIALMIVIIKLQPKPEHNIAEEVKFPVSYVTVSAHQIQPEIIGFGVVKPDRNLQAKAEVAGRITYLHPNLKKGEIFEKGTLLIQLDEKDYLLQLKQSQADLLVTKANLQEIELSIENNELELELANEKLKVRKAEYQRLKKLSKTGVISQSNLDAERQNLLQQKQEVQKLINQKTILPSSLEVMKAQLAISKARLQKSERDLKRTQVILPFKGRISSVYTELDQFMTIGASLFDATGLAKMSINSQFPIDQFSAFIKSFEHKKSDEISTNEMTQLLSSLELTATIEEVAGEFSGWTAKVERFSDNLDPKSRTVGVILTVEGSYQTLQPGTRPPLLEGMYVKTRLRGRASEKLVLPRFALHEEQVYLATKDNRLNRINLERWQFQGELLLLEPDDIIRAGDRIITSDIYPAVNGMGLLPLEDGAVRVFMDKQLGEDQ